MYKLKIISMLLACTLLLSGCSLLPWNWEYWDRKEPRVERMSGDTGVIAETRFEIILTAIENKDAEAIKAMFSTTALAEAQDIDGAINYLFNLFDGEVVSWELKSNSTGRTYGEGGSHELIRTFFNVYTKKADIAFSRWTIIKTQKTQICKGCMPCVELMLPMPKRSGETGCS